MPGFGISSAGAYAPAYVPAYVDWRHSGGYNGYGYGSGYDIEALPNALKKKLDKKMQKQAVRAHAKRMNYAKSFRDFRKEVLEDFEEEDLKRPAVELLGEELDPKKDLIYVTYVIDEDTVDKMETILDFVIDAFHKHGLGEHFRVKPEGALPKAEEEDHLFNEGDVVSWIWPRRNHEYPEFDQDMVDFFEPEEEEEGGGGAF